MPSSVQVGYEVDFLPVGRKGPGGDAIALRVGDLIGGSRDDQFVAVVDGGYTRSGEKLVEHIRDHYDTDVVDVVVSTHLDRDHIQGLTAVVENLNVQQLWMHEPTTKEEDLIRSASEAASGQRKDQLQAVTASLGQSRDLATLARDRGVTVVAPYSGLVAADGALQIIGPSEAYYHELVPQFRDYRARESLVAMVGDALEAKTGKAIRETLEHETLEEGARTEPENNSSVISLIQVDGHATILTGDAGEDALIRAANQLDSLVFDWTTLRAIQIPHHGSRKNVTPSILDRYLGNKVQTKRTRQAYVSCSASGAPLHPAKRVTNAFIRRGCTVYQTAGKTKRLHHNAPERLDFVKADEIPFYDEVD